jgi:hypothetical protein
MRSGLYHQVFGEVFARSQRNEIRGIFLIWLVLGLGISNVRGQAPNLISFQGVARDASGKVVANTSIRLHIRIVSDAQIGNTKLDEYHDVTTSSTGVFNLIIGSQTPNFANVVWGNNKFFLQVGIDVNGGNDYIQQPDVQLISVPFAIHAGESEKFQADVPAISVGTIGGYNNFPVVGNGARFIWHPKKGAFRAGNITSGQWEDSNIGPHSIALGENVTAKSPNSIAIGTGAIVELGSTNSIAIGEHVTSDAASVTTLGRFNALNISGGRLLQIGNGTSDATRNNVMTILKTGMVGIGTNVLNPEYLLDIGNRIRIRSNPDQSITAGIWLNNSTNNRYAFIGGKNDSEVGFFFEGKGWFFNVHENGSAWLAGNLSQNSDRRLKRDFSPLSNSLSKLSQLVGQHYFWKDTTKSQELQTGLIAQEVEQYFPELVTTDEKGFKAVNYIGLIPHLIESVKALKTQTDTISVLQKQVQELHAEVTDMKTAQPDEVSE